MSFSLAALVVLVAGAAIGATSIGGILVVPALTSIAGVAVAPAIAASSFGFLLTGAWAWRTNAAERAAALRSLLGLHAAALIGAIGGALAIHQVPNAWMRAWIAILALASGVYALATAERASAGTRPWPTGGRLAGIGLVVGIGSAVSGTGGPVLLLPILLLLGIATAPAVATALAIQLPIALASSATNIATGTLDLRLGLVVGLTLIVGAWGGHRLAMTVDAVALRRVVAVVLIATGLWYGFS
ncbi:MAG: sulfite exporter TauE/SafE family protein [Burkholderiales bacterium]